VIVLFGASSDIGRRAAGLLLDDGLDVRLVARAASDLDPRADCVRGDMSAVARLARDADVVVSCAHARHNFQLLEGLPDRVQHLVLVGSAWRYSHVPNPDADIVRQAEQAFIASGRNGVMLHPTMIYGGKQEYNLRRLLAVIKSSPVLPLPGGGRHLVQPIHVDDVAASIVAAVKRTWPGPSVIPIAGPRPMPWREMAAICIDALGRRCWMLPVPLRPAIAVAKFLRMMGIPTPIDPNELLRFREDVNLPIAAMSKELSVSPREFAAGLRQVLAERQ
jgi:uncharacterized protein YbjT (DUF2867 family)